MGHPLGSSGRWLLPFAGHTCRGTEGGGGGNQEGYSSMIVVMNSLGGKTCGGEEGVRRSSACKEGPGAWGSGYQQERWVLRQHHEGRTAT